MALGSKVVHGSEVHCEAQGAVPCRWTGTHLAELTLAPANILPHIPVDIARPQFPDLDLWDMWPVQERDGSIAVIAGSEWWFILSAPRLPDPDDRHKVARIRLVERHAGGWRDHGNAFADGFTPGSREWAGCAVRHTGSAAIDLYFTAAGERGDQRDNWQQRIFAATGRLAVIAGTARIDWAVPQEVIVADGVHYQPVTAASGRAGFIKGFRDPAWFGDPVDGAEYLLFTASLAGATSEYDGAIGWAQRQADGGWQLRAPLVAMDGVNNEPERPHVVRHDGRYYLFFSTQSRMFAPGVPAGPNGLYGMVADRMAGPWRPLNGSGLVAANPPEAPAQAYSWWVTAELDVFGFADMLGPPALPGQTDHAWRRAHFGGVPAPVFRLALSGASAMIRAA